MRSYDANSSAAARRREDELYLDIRPEQGGLVSVKQGNEKLLKDLMLVERRLRECKPQTDKGKEAIREALN